MRLPGVLVVAAIGALAVPGLVIGFLLKKSEAERKALSAAAAARDEAAPERRRGAPAEGDAGDVRLGRELFEIHCASCHGLSGRGDGPSAALLHPPPRNLSDPAFLASVDDERIARAIALGGPGVSRSRIMPSFADRFDAFEIAAIVAHLRSEALAIEDLVSEARGASARETVLDDGAVVTYFDARDRNGETIARVLFDTDGGAAIAVAPDGTLARATTIGGAEPTPETRRALRSRLDAAVARHAADVEEAARLRDAYRENAASFSPGARLFAEGCASCHGPAGRPVETEAAQLTHRPALLADAARQGRLSDAELADLLRRGGAAFRISEAMPSYGGVYSAEEIAAIVAHVRTLAVPRAEEKGNRP